MDGGFACSFSARHSPLVFGWFFAIAVALAVPCWLHCSLTVVASSHHAPASAHSRFAFHFVVGTRTLTHNHRNSPALIAAQALVIVCVSLRNKTNKLPKFIFRLFPCASNSSFAPTPIGWRPSGPLYHSSCHGNSKSSCCGSPNLL